MSKAFDFNLIRDLIVSMTHERVSEDAMQKLGEINTTSNVNLEEEFQEHLKHLSAALSLCNKARSSSDSLTLRAGLSEIKAAAVNLESFFSAIQQDLLKIIIYERDLPGSMKFPENYQIPEHYHYK